MTDAKRNGNGQTSVSLDELLAASIDALARLDAAEAESLAEILEGGTVNIELPDSPALRAQARSRHWILNHLLHATGDRLAMLRRVSTPKLPFAAYGPAARASN